MVRVTIVEGRIDDIEQTEVVLIMIHIKNLQLTRALEEFISPIKKQDNVFYSLQHLYVLDLTVYVFLHKEKRILKSAK